MIDKAAVTAERRIRMAGPLNFRDLGGYPTCTGETVRWRRAFRADSLGSMTEEDAGRLTGELGVRTVIDLRTRGVNDDDIARDYALTAPAMPGILLRARTWSAEAGGTPAFPPQVYGAGA